MFRAMNPKVKIYALYLQRQENTRFWLYYQGRVTNQWKCVYNREEREHGNRCLRLLV